MKASRKPVLVMQNNNSANIECRTIAKHIFDYSESPGTQLTRTGHRPVEALDYPSWDREGTKQRDQRFDDTKSHPFQMFLVIKYCGSVGANSVSRNRFYCSVLVMQCLVSHTGLVHLPPNAITSPVGLLWLASLIIPSSTSPGPSVHQSRYTGCPGRGSGDQIWCNLHRSLSSTQLFPYFG